MQTREWVLTAAVIIVPLLIAIVVTIWSLDQVRYRPKKRQPVGAGPHETNERGGGERKRAGGAEH